VLAFNHADQRSSRLCRAARVDFECIIVQPQRLRVLEIDPVLGEIRRAFGRVEFEGHTVIYYGSGMETIPDCSKSD